MNNQKGFTLIELVVVIVILGILAAVAVPRFVDLSTEADAAAVQGVAGAISSGMAINFAACKADPTSVDCETIDNCGNSELVLQSGVLPAGYVETDAATTVADDDSASCTLTSPDGATAEYTILGT